MSKKPLISIIVPIYKVKKEYIKKCINSLKNQTYDNIEVLLMFDGAEEYIIDFCKNMVKEDSRFYIYSRENKGVSTTRNEGIKLAQGEWITFVDADDWIEINACQVFVDEYTENDNIDFYTFKTFFNYVNKEVKYKDKKDYKHIIGEDEKKSLFASTYGTKKSIYHVSETVWKNFYRKKFILENNIFFPSDIKIGEDMLFNYMVWLKSKEGMYINKAIYHYRISEDSVMNSEVEVLQKKYNELFPVFEKYIELLPSKYKENYHQFIIRQLERFCLNYYFKNKCMIKEFKEFVSNKYYKEKIKEAKTNNLSIKHKLFLILLKNNLYYCIYIFCFLYNKK